VALLATAFITMIAAGAAIVVIQLTLDSTRVESANTERSAAKADAEAVKVAFEEALAAAPYFYYSEVFEYERARICTQDGGAVHQPGTPWPKACGTTWGYQKADAAGEVRVEIVAPGVDDPRLRLRILSGAGRSEYGLEIHYATESPARWSLYSGGDLALDLLPSGVNELRGEIYAKGVIDLPSANIPMTRGLIASEGGYGAHPDASPLSSNPIRFYGPSSDGSGSVHIESIREIYPTEADLVGVAAMFAAGVDMACPGTDPVSVGTRASHFCLNEGANLLDAEDNLVEVPTGNTAYLLLTGAGGGGTIDVYYSAKTSTAPESCGAGCDLAADSASALSGGTHPGSLTYWTKLGTFALPDDGMIAVDRETHIGLCGSGFASVDGSCSTWSGSSGMEVADNLTILVGGLVNIANVYISGPVNLAEGKNFGVVASGSVRIAYWSRPLLADLRISGTYTGLGIGGATTSVATWPEIVEDEDNRGGVLTLEGGLVGVGIGTNFPLYDAVEILGAETGWLEGPPLYPSYYGTWRVVAMRYLPSIEVCSQVVCETY